MNSIFQKFLYNVRHSMSTHLSVSILLMAVPVFILALGIFFIQSRYFIRKEAAQHVNSVLNTTIHHVCNYMSAVRTATNANTWLVEDHFDPHSIQGVTQQIVRLNRHVNGCTITIEPGMFPSYDHFFSANTTHTGDTTTVTTSEKSYYYHKAWYKKAKETGQPCWVDPFQDNDEKTDEHDHLTAKYCKPLYNKSGQLIGVIASDLSLHKLSETIKKACHAFPESYYVLVNSQGNYLIHPDLTYTKGRTIFTGADPNRHSDRIALGHEMTAGNNGTMHITLDGRLYHVSYSQVPGTDWSLALVCPDSNILKSYHQLLYIIIAIIAIGLLVITTLSHHIVSRAIRPLSQLVDTTQQIAAGKYDEFIPRTNRDDAIGQLQNSFATMQQSLNFHMGGIRHTTEETKKQNEELTQVTKLAEKALRQKTEFIQNVSHQIRTPLNIIMGFSQVLRESLTSRRKGVKSTYIDKDDEIAIISEAMRHNARHLERMVLMLFDSSDVGVFEEQQIRRDDKVSCNEVARESIRHTQHYFPSILITMESELPDDICIQSNRLSLMHTLRELLYNAAKYSDGKHLTVRITQTDSTVRFIVEDTGTGISEEEQKKIFKPFAKVDDLSEGLGLGLPLAKRHAISLGGDILLDSSYHAGCRFIVEMPK